MVRVVEGGEAVSEGHFSWKSERLERRSKAARYDELVVLPEQALDERTVRLSFVAPKRVKLAVMSSKAFIPTKLGQHVCYFSPLELSSGHLTEIWLQYSLNTNTRVITVMRREYLKVQDTQTL